MKTILVLLASFVGLVAIAEIGCRLTMGFGNPALYIPDPEIGYLLVPNQKTSRFGNQIEINQYSMRNKEIQKTKKNNTERILFLGDSVVYGTGRLDQSETIPALTEQKLQTENRSVEVLNAAANSWSPRNELAYLKRFGLFNADILILVINTDDLFAAKPSSLLVGKTYSYPTQSPPLALIEVYQSLEKPLVIPELEQLRNSEKNKLAKNLAAIAEIKQLAETSGTKFVLAMTPLLEELKAKSTPEAVKGRKKLQALVVEENIEYLDFLKIWSDFPQPEFLYRDHIHPNLQGNTKITETITQFLRDR